MPARRTRSRRILAESIPVHCSPGRDRELLDRCLSSFTSYSVSFTDSWDHFVRLVHSAPCGVIVERNLRDLPDSCELDSTKGAGAPTELILVTQFLPENVGHLLSWRKPQHVVWFHDLNRELPQVLSGITLENPARILSTLFLGLRGMPSELQNVFLHLGGGVLPPRTIQGLCRRVSIKEDRFRYLWRRSKRLHANPKDILDWFILGSSLTLYERCRSWQKVAKEMGMRQESLRSIGKRLTGKTLCEIARSGPNAFRLQVFDWWSDSVVSTITEIRGSVSRNSG